MVDEFVIVDTKWTTMEGVSEGWKGVEGNEIGNKDGTEECGSMLLK